MLLGRLSLAATAVVGALLVAACTNPISSGGTAGSGGATSASSSTSGSGGTATSSTGTGGSPDGGATGSGGGSVLEPSGFACSGKKPSLDSAVVPITSPNCGTMAACHLAMVSGSGVHDQLVNRIAEECDDLRNMVTPGDPEHSYVIHKLTGHNLCSPATTMPLDGTRLSDADIQTVYDWICEGAPQN